MTPTPVTDTATADRARAISDVTSEVQRDTLEMLRADYIRLLEQQSEERGEWDKVITERDALRKELAATVERNIELERKRVSLECEVDRLDARLRVADSDIGRCPRP